MSWDVYFAAPGGDKRHDWTGWYERNVPLADEIYDEYLRAEGLA